MLKSQGSQLLFQLGKSGAVQGTLLAWLWIRLIEDGNHGGSQ